MYSTVLCIFKQTDILETWCLVFSQVSYNQLRKINKKLSTANIDYISLFTDSINTSVRLFLIFKLKREPVRTVQ